MTLVIIESPFGRNPDGSVASPDVVKENADYLARCMAHSLHLGEAPFASHRLYPGVLDDTSAEDRCLGMHAGWSWMRRADYVAVYTDRGITPGMRAGISTALSYGLPVVYRLLPVA